MAPEFMKILVAVWRVPDEVECSGPPAASTPAVWLEFVIELVLGDLAPLGEELRCIAARAMLRSLVHCFLN